MESRRNKGKIFQYPVESLARAIEAVRNGMPVLKASQTFKVPRTTLRSKLNVNCPLDVRKVGPECKLGKEIEEKLVEWVLGMASRGFPIDKNGLLSSVKKIINEANLGENFKNELPGKKWLSLFLKRHPIISQKHAEYVSKARAMVTEENIRSWFNETRELLGDNVDILNFPDRVWNMDETAMFLSPKGSLVLAERGKSSYDVTSTSEKDNVTTLITANAAGVLAPPLTIFKYDRLPSIISKSAPPGWGIGKSDNGWMQSDTFYEYFTNVFVPFLEKQNTHFPIIVFIDGHKSHLSLHLSKFCREREIILISLHPNTTHLMQPLDVAFFFPLKQAWKKIVKKWIFEHDGQSLQKKDVPSALNEILKENDFKIALISGFKSSGLCPFNEDAVDYSKCLNKSKNVVIEKSSTETTKNDETPEETILQHLAFIESNFDEGILRQFNETFSSNGEFAGELSYLELYRFWSKIKTSLGHQPNENYFMNENNLVYDDTIEFSFPELDLLQNNGYQTDKEMISLGLKDHQDTLQENVNATSILEDNNQKNNGRSDNQTDKEILSELTNHEDTLEESVNTPSVLEDKKTNNDGSSEDPLDKEILPELNNQDALEGSDNSASVLEDTKTNNDGRSEDKICVLENIVIKPQHRSTEQILDKILIWPEITSAKKKNKRQREHMPSVLTSDKWLELVEAKDAEKKKLEEEKAQKRLKREQAKKEKNAANEKKNATKSTGEPKFTVNAFVILKYEQNHYPAKILKMSKKLAFCSAMHKSGLNWRWPQKMADTLWYPHEDLIEKISPPTLINSRGIYSVPEMEKYV